MESQKFISINTRKALDAAISSIYSLSKPEETFRQLQKDGNTEDIFKTVIKYVEKDFDGFFSLPISLNRKDDETSNKLREEGNEFFKIKKLREALEKYNKCIFAATHPKLHYETEDKTECSALERDLEKLKFETKDENDYSALSRGYGNRSAVLLQLKEYTSCISDIDRSLEICCCETTQFKLTERKVKCLIAIEKYEEAKVLLETCRAMLNNLVLEERVKESYKKSLSKLHQQSDQGKEKHQKLNIKQKTKFEEIKCASISASFSNDELIFAYNNPTPPSLDDEPNPTIPAFSRALKLQYSPDQGRYVVATRDIKPGEVIAVETAYASYSCPEKPNSSYDFCMFCLSRCAAPLPCQECTDVVFCNEECRSKGWEKFHMKECQIYPRLQILDGRCVGAYRIIAGQSLDELRIMIPKFQTYETRSALENILDENKMCDSHSYRSVYFLQNLIKTMNTKRLFDIAVKAFLMTQLLKESNNLFISDDGNKILLDLEDIVFIGSLFIRHICAIDCNQYRIYETHLITNDKNYGNNYSPQFLGVGDGIYIAESLFNHSCCPSAKLNFYGNVGVCRAISFISYGDQVNMQYGGDYYYTRPDRNIRRDHLLNKYSFFCKCEACECNFDMKEWDFNLFLDTYFPNVKLREKSRRICRSNLETTGYLQSVLKDLLKRNHLMFSKITDSCFDVNEYYGLVQETIEYFCRFVEMPDQLYIQLSVIFREILQVRGPCYFVEESNFLPAIYSNQLESYQLGNFQ